MNADDKPHFVYLCIVKNTKIKIGRTWRLDLRVRRLGSGRRKKPVLSGYIICNNVWAAKELESKLLRFFHRGKIPRKKPREWFSFDPLIIHSFFSIKGSVICI